MKRRLLWLALSGSLIPLGIAGAVYFMLWRSLPTTQLSERVESMSRGVTVLEDQYGVPTVKGQAVLDLVRAQGWLLARDRFFQMDLIRRQMAGKLAEIFGTKAVDRDVWHRRFGFSQVAEKAAELMSEENRAIWEAYTAGVNAYLSRGPLPWECKLLRYTPEPWTVKDSLLVVLSMFETLNDPTNEDERAYHTLLQKFPPPVVDFLTSEAGFFDMPLVKNSAATRLQIPEPKWIDFRKQARLSPHIQKHLWAHSSMDHDVSLGSNAWAVAGSRTKSGKPLLAGDPHLALNVPNLWYRLRLEGDGLAVTGASLPGVPGIVIGANQKLAWSFTNSKSDVHDDVEVTPNPERTHYDYLGKKWAFVFRQEKIEVRRHTARVVTVRETVVGPIVHEEGNKWRALQWTALDPLPLSELNPIRYNKAQTLSALLADFAHWGGPVQNAIIATSDNHIAWALIGKIPNRIGFDGKVTVVRDSQHAWNGMIPFAQMPKIIDPPAGFVVSANQRMVEEPMADQRLGHNWPSAVRGYRIAQMLKEARHLDGRGMQQMQLDTQSVTHLWYRDTLLKALKVQISHPDAVRESPEYDFIKVIETLCQQWSGTADKNSAAYVFLKEFRYKVLANTLSAFIAQIPTESRADVSELIGRDSLIKNLWESKPAHLLPVDYPSYESLWVESALEAGHRLARSAEDLKKLRWGDRNQSAIRHPLSIAFPRMIGKWLDFPEREMDGDALVVRVAKPNNGASLRMVVDLSDSTQSLFAQPGGASGHVLSPHYRDLFESWIAGEGVPFEPAASVSAWHLVP